jgi:hypothetical protein
MRLRCRHIRWSTDPNAPGAEFRAVASEAIRDRIAYKPISRFESGRRYCGIRFLVGMKLQTATFRYKRGFRPECICHDDMYR